MKEILGFRFRIFSKAGLLRRSRKDTNQGFRRRETRYSEFSGTQRNIADIALQKINTPACLEALSPNTISSIRAMNVETIAASPFPLPPSVLIDGTPALECDLAEAFDIISLSKKTTALGGQQTASIGWLNISGLSVASSSQFWRSCVAARQQRYPETV